MVNYRRTAIPICPAQGCAQRLTVDTGRYESGHDPATGLQHWCCPACGHLGMTASHGIHLLFRGGLEYLFNCGTSLSTLTVILSGAAVGLYRSHGIGPDQLAVHAAEWALLSGQTTGTVRLSLEDRSLSDFYTYFHQKLEPSPSGQVA